MPIPQTQQSKLQVKTLEEEGKANWLLYSSSLERNCKQTFLNQVGGNNEDFSIYRMILLVEKPSNNSFNTLTLPTTHAFDSHITKHSFSHCEAERYS